MVTPDDNSADGASGMLNGHGVGVAMVAIFVGMALVVASVASDGAIFGLNFSSASDNNAPVIDSETGGPDVLPRDAFDEGSGENAQSDGDSNLASTPPERSATLSEEEKRLLSMSHFSWDSIAVQHIAASQDTMNIFDQQNFTRQKPAHPGTEPLFLSDRILVDVDRDENVVAIETPVDAPDEEQEEEPQDDAGQHDGGGADEGGSGNEGDSDSGGSGNNSTDTNSTSTPGPSESSDNGDGVNSTTSIEASISLG